MTSAFAATGDDPAAPAALEVPALPPPLELFVPPVVEVLPPDAEDVVPAKPLALPPDDDCPPLARPVPPELVLVLPPLPAIADPVPAVLVCGSVGDVLQAIAVLQATMDNAQLAPILQVSSRVILNPSRSRNEVI